MFTDVTLIALAYLLGSFSLGLLLARWRRGVDLRHHGSGNIGATNVARTLGKTAGILTLLSDCVKGLGAVLLAQWWGSSLLITAAAALGAVLGHLFPVYYGFRGGKGVATALGVLLPILPWPLVGGVGAWLLVVLLWRYVSAGSLLAAAVVPTLAALRGDPWPLVVAAIAIALLIIAKHRRNIHRLLQGQESKLW